MTQLNDLSDIASPSVSNLSRYTWISSFKKTAMGYSDEIFPDLKLIVEPITVGTFGKKLKLGQRIIGLEGTVKIQMREIILANIQLLSPQWDGVSPSIPLCPPMNTDTYDLSALLTIHPYQLPVTDMSMDINLLHCWPMTTLNIKRDGTKDDVWEVDLEPYPDRADLVKGLTTYGWIGPVPAGY